MKILEKLASKGKSLSLGVENTLDVDAPKGLLTPDLVAEIKNHKAQLVDELKKNIFPGAYLPDTNAQTPKATQADKIFVPELNRTNKRQTELSLSSFQQKAQAAKNLNELHQCLEDFSRHRWTLLERADMSSSYTPPALKLIYAEGEDKWKTLEELACLCWNPS